MTSVSRLSERRLIWWACLALGSVIALVSSRSSGITSGHAWLAILGAVLITAGLLGWAISRQGWSKTFTSPLGVVVLLLACLFVLRPAGLISDPTTVLPGLARVGFTWADLTRAVGIGSLGFAIFGSAFLLTWGRERWAPLSAVEAVADRRLTIGVAAALLLGSALWLPVFLRNGGIHALLHDPAAIHLGQYGAGYGSVGYGICLGAFVAALFLWLWHPGRVARLLLVVSGVVAIVAAVCLQTRGPLIATAAAGIVLVLARRTLSRRQVVAGVTVAVVLVFGLFYMRAVRDYTQTRSLGVAVTAAAKKNPVTLPGADFAELDGLVAVERLVPAALPRLGGSSLASIPGIFIPRRLWRHKPFPIDRRLARTLYGPKTQAGIPFTLAGEMLWNFGVAGALAAMAVAGALAGLGWGLLARRGSPLAWLLRALVVGYSYLLMTRPLAPMILTLGFGVVGLMIAGWLMGLIEPARALRRLRTRRRTAIAAR